MRRKRGTDLTRNEHTLLAAALRLRYLGTGQLYGYELFATLRAWEGAEPMNHGTLYRGLRALEGRGLFTSAEDDGAGEGERYRVFYELTADGLAAARRSTVQLAALEHPPSWIDIGLAAPAPEDR